MGVCQKAIFPTGKDEVRLREDLLEKMKVIVGSRVPICRKRDLLEGILRRVLVGNRPHRDFPSFC